jgi:hypothetical protein
VINSYQAVESLANVVYARKQIEKLVAQGSSQEDAEAETEKLRRKHRVGIKFLVHYGLFDACARSRSCEEKQLYDAVCELNKLRHAVAHAGRKPSATEAEAAHVLCCQVVRWHCEVGSLPVRPMMPDEKDQAAGLLSLPSDVNAISGATRAVLLSALGVTPLPGFLETPCQIGLAVEASQGEPPPH